MLGAKVLRRGDLVFAFDDGDDVQAEDGGGVDEKEADGAGAEDDGGLAGVGVRFFKTTDHAGEGFGEGGVLEGDVVGDEEGVFFDDAGGDADVLGVSTVVEEEIVAEVLLVVEAEEAGVAGGGVEGQDAVADREFCDAVADFNDGPGELVTEEAVKGEHLGVVAAAIDFEVSAAGEGRANAQN